MDLFNSRKPGLLCD